MCVSPLVPELPQAQALSAGAPLQKHFSADSTQGGDTWLCYTRSCCHPLHLLLVPFSGCCAVQPIRAQGQSQAWSCWGRAVLLQTCLRSIVCIVVSFNCINHPPYHAPVLLHRIDRAALLPCYSPLGEWQSSLLSPCIVSLFVQFSTNATLITSHSNSIVRQNYPPPYHFSAYEYFLKSNDFLLPNVLWNEETCSLQI